MQFEKPCGVFRALTPAQAPLAAQLADAVKAAGYDHWDENYPNEAIFREDAQAGELFGFFIDDKLVAIICACFNEAEFEDVADSPGANWPQSRKPCMLCRLCVDPAYRRRGIAAAMMRNAAQQAALRGADQAWLLVATDNANALKIYEGLGYTRCGQTFVFGTDFYCYILNLQRA